MGQLGTITIQGDDMDLFEIAETKRMRREEAAARLHALADALASNLTTRSSSSAKVAASR